MPFLKPNLQPNLKQLQTTFRNCTNLHPAAVLPWHALFTGTLQLVPLTFSSAQGGPWQPAPGRDSEEYRRLEAPKKAAAQHRDLA